MAGIYDIYRKRKGFEILCPLGSYPLFLRKNKDDKEEMVRFLAREHNRHETGSLYVHIPFCDSLCNFCCFYRTLLEETQAEQYLDALKSEIIRYADTGYIRSGSFASVYIGGGTPTSLKTEQLIDLLSLLKERFNIRSGAEITVETTTHNAERGKLEALYENGVNRLSFGVQTFKDSIRNILTLKDTSSEAISAIHAAQEIGFENIDIDLMYNLPGQSMDDWRLDLRQAVELGLESISPNPLFVARGTAFAEQIAAGEIPPVSSDRTEIDMYLLAIDELKSAGYRQQNLVHFVLPEKEHLYARMRFGSHDCLALGASGGGVLDAYLYGNVRGVNRYIKSANSGSPVDICAHLTVDELMHKYMIWGLHSIEVSKDAFRKLFGRELTEIFPEQIERLEKRGLIESDDSTIALTTAGKVWCTSVAEEFCPERYVTIFERMFGD